MSFVVKARRVASGLFVLIFVAILSGCATPMSAALSKTPPNGQRQLELIETPFFPQVDYFCGPAALATVLRSAGIELTPEQVAPQIYLPGRKGSLQLELLVAARRQGALATLMPGSFSALIAELKSGNPVLILQNLGLEIAPSWHYAVVVGYDFDAEEFVLRSGADPRMRMGYKVFERTWQRADRWAIVVTHPSRLSASATPEEMAKALVALERLNPGVTIPGYKAAIKRWPDDANFYLGLSNAAYSTGDEAGAMGTLVSLLKFAPGNAVALNNLANIFLKRGELEAARDYAARASRIQGPWQISARQTLAEVDAALAQQKIR